MDAWKRDLILFLAILGFVALSAKCVPAAELDRLAIEYGRYHPSARIPEMPGYKAKEGLAVLFDLSIVGPLYWRNRVHGLTDPGQYRLVGWQFELGADPFFWRDSLRGHLEFFYAHHSQHLLEGAHPWIKFPVNDQLGLRWTLYKRD